MNLLKYQSIEISVENQNKIKEFFGDKYTVKLSMLRSSLPAEFTVIDNETERGFVIKEGAMIAYDPEKKAEGNIILIPPKYNQEGKSYFYEVQKV